jgi:hypothetical protein
MKRISYDADTQKYIFRDSTTGRLWESEPGSAYGELMPGSYPFLVLHLPSNSSTPFISYDVCISNYHSWGKPFRRGYF